MKTAIVTGGAAGIGAACVERLRQDGWHVGILDLATSESQEDGVRATKCDVTDQASVETGFSEILTGWPPLKGLVNCAGIGRAATFDDTTVELFRQVLDVNVIGTFVPCKEAVRRMKENGGGAIINLSSVAGNRGSFDRTAYGSSKAAVKMMSEVMAVELASHNIRVNTIAPGPIDTELVAKMHDAETRAEWTKIVPQTRYAPPREVSGAAAFLLSDEASFITGHCLNVDGGFTAAGLQRR